MWARFALILQRTGVAKRRRTSRNITCNGYSISSHRVPYASPTSMPMPVHGIDHLELYVGNAAQAAFYFTRAFGFTRPPTPASRPGAATAFARARAGAHPARRSPAPLGRGRDRRAPQAPRRRRAQDRAERARTPRPPTATRSTHGARGSLTPHWIEDEHGRVRLSSVATYGHTRPPVRGARRLRRRRSSPASRRAPRRPPTRSSPASTTWSATSSSATWRSGWATTSASSA